MRSALFRVLSSGTQVEALVRPWRLKAVVNALSASGILGVTATSVDGIGAQGDGEKER